MRPGFRKALADQNPLDELIPPNGGIFLIKIDYQYPLFIPKGK